MSAERRRPISILVALPILMACFVAALTAPVSAEEKRFVFAEPRLWAVEQMPGGEVKIGDGRIETKDAAGCTLWWRERLAAPVRISFTVTAIAGSGPLHRVSDVNCFWMATDPRGSDAPFSPSFARSGKFADYGRLQTYYVGMGGNNNATTRFRRYEGSGARPLLPEHDLSATQFLLEGNRAYRIRIVVTGDGAVEYWRDGKRFFRYVDPEPLASGWFAFRTVRSHLRIDHFEIRPL